MPEIPFGQTTLSFDLPERFTKLDTPYPEKRSSFTTEEISSKIKHGLQSPFGEVTSLASISEISTIAIVVDDITRPTPADQLLPPLLEYLHEDFNIEKSNIVIIFGLGVHRKMTEDEARKKLGEQVASEYKWENHDCRNNLINLGTTSRGTPIQVNKTYYDADLKISLGLIEPHLWAGYSGGQKGIIPGIAGVDTIYHHHKLVKHSIVDVGKISDNPFREDLEEMVEKIGLDLLMNVILTPSKKIHDIVIGEVNEAFKEGVMISRKLSEISIDQQADVIISTPAPLGIDFRQSSKAAFNTKNALKKGGTMIVVSECPEGRGNVSASESPPKRGLIRLLAKILPSRVLMWIIKKQGYGIEDAAGTFRMFKFIANYNYKFVSPNTSPEDREILFVADHYDTVEEALASINKKEKNTVHIFPLGGATYPVISK